MALATIVLWMIWVLSVDMRLGTYFHFWNWLPLQFSLALGPLIFFYVLKITRPEYKFHWKDLLNFGPLLLEQVVWMVQVKEGITTGSEAYNTSAFRQLIPLLHLAAFISVSACLCWSFRLIESFYQRLKFNNVRDRYRYQLQWLYRLLTGFGLLWLVLVGKLAGVFAGLAIFISCLGLFGLAAYVAEQRTKEIGIRKVLGASVAQVWLTLSRDFIVLVVISCVIASPMAFYYLHAWLQKYTYRVSIRAKVFIVSGMAAIVITLCTISFQAIKAALANPVKSLRSE